MVDVMQITPYATNFIMGFYCMINGRVRWKRVIRSCTPVLNTAETRDRKEAEPRLTEWYHRIFSSLISETSHSHSSSNRQPSNAALGIWWVEKAARFLHQVLREKTLEYAAAITTSAASNCNSSCAGGACAWTFYPR